MKIKVLLQNSKKIDRRIWIELPTKEEEIEEAIEDITVDAEDGYIICDYEKKTNCDFYVSAYDDVFEINRKLLNIEEAVN